MNWRLRDELRSLPTGRPLGVITLLHTEVPPELAGKGIGSTLVRGALEDVRRQGLRMVVRCSFIKGFMTKHPEFNDLLSK